METIKVYLDNMFAGLPKTEELEHLKKELLSGMEEKYHELKREGKSENEAIGIVISEFGNIEELTAELGIDKNRQEFDLPILSEEEAYAYTTARRSSGFWTGLGVFLCVSGVALLIFLDALFENNSIMGDNSSMEMGLLLGLIGMFVLIAVAVGMFIYSGMRLDRFKNLEQGFQLPYSLKTDLQRGQNLFALTYRISVIMGVCLCVLSPTLIIAATFINDDLILYGVSAFLVTVALAVFLFVYYGNIQGAYTKLLEEQQTSKAEKKESERIIGAVAGIVWPLATVVFLFTGFVYQRWDINWAIFPITAILFGMFSNVYHIMKRKKVS
ncbi:permease prefix domain 1-containing protein [Paenibacillus endoradicis]|uniref:permease prefix domain 1-containing protein n=1 Tax=Paenibacillus endoradicis TaxID=2972487 RepID=UPI002158FCDB|nr:permease prefix domain 1-containing protein [Paenibacillus endoradicis]MCR8656485.1 permease prefix domain 1-containing protein [Paenibacillus endoradicis]